MLITCRTPDDQVRPCRGCAGELAIQGATESGTVTCQSCGTPLESGDESVLVVCLEESQMIQGENWKAIETGLSALVNQLQTPRLLLSLRQVRLLSSTAFGGLLSLNRRVDSAGGRLVLCDVQPQVQEVFNFTRLVKVIEIRGTVGEGLAAFAA